MKRIKDLAFYRRVRSPLRQDAAGYERLLDWKPNMNTLQIFFVAAALFVLAACLPVYARRPIVQSDYKVPEGLIDTGVMGSVPCPSGQELARMQHSQYILHARDGKLRKVRVEKLMLPHDPKAHPQSANGYTQSVVLDDDTIVTVSGTSDRTDGDGTWASWIGHTDMAVIRWRLVD